MIFLHRNVILQLTYKSHQGSPFFVGSWLELHGYWWKDWCLLHNYLLFNKFYQLSDADIKKENKMSTLDGLGHNIKQFYQVGKSMEVFLWSVCMSLYDICLSVCLNLYNNFSFNNVSGFEPILHAFKFFDS